MIYTKDNPKLVEHWNYFDGRTTFTGAVKDLGDNIVYFLNGKPHREDGPACEWYGGYKAWFLNGILYGENDEITNESWIRFVKLELLK